MANYYKSKQKLILSPPYLNINVPNCCCCCCYHYYYYYFPILLTKLLTTLKK